MKHMTTLKSACCALIVAALPLCGGAHCSAQQPAMKGAAGDKQAVVDVAPPFDEDHFKAPDFWKGLRELVLDAGRNRLDRPFLMSGSRQEIATRLDVYPLTDGRVDEHDLQHMRKYHQRTDVDMPELDINRDGRINLLDWALMDVEITNGQVVTPYAIVFDDGESVIAVPVGDHLEISAVREGRASFSDIPMLAPPGDVEPSTGGPALADPPPKGPPDAPVSGPVAEPQDIPFGPFLLENEAGKCPWELVLKFAKLRAFGPLTWTVNHDASPDGPLSTSHRLQIYPFFYNSVWEHGGCFDEEANIGIERCATRRSRLRVSTGAKFEEYVGLNLGIEWEAENSSEECDTWSSTIRFTREWEAVIAHAVIGYHVIDDMIQQYPDGRETRQTDKEDIRTLTITRAAMYRRCLGPPCEWATGP